MRTLPFFKPKNKPQFAGLNVSDASSGGGGGGGGDTSSLVNKSDITPIILIGTTNTSGNVISAGTWFYLNGTPCIAKVDIASGATFTEGTNYEEKTVGSALSELNSNITASNLRPTNVIDLSSYTTLSNAFTVPADGYIGLNAQTTLEGHSAFTIYGATYPSTNFNIALVNPVIQYQGTSLFVRKGLIVICPLLHSGHVAYYFPLTTN